MNDIAGDREDPMRNPLHPGEPIRESMDVTGWNMIGTAACVSRGRGTSAGSPNGELGMTAKIALALKDLGWVTTGGG